MELIGVLIALAVILSGPILAVVWFVSSVRKGRRREGRGDKLRHMICAAVASTVIFLCGFAVLGAGNDAGMLCVLLGSALLAEVPLMEAPVEDIVDGMGGIIRQVADYRNYPDAIGYSFRFYAERMVPDDQIRLLCVNGIEPTVQNISDGTYPLGGEFYAVRLESNDNPQIDAFIEWMLSEQGQELVRKTGYVPLNP